MAAANYRCAKILRPAGDKRILL